MATTKSKSGKASTVTKQSNSQGKTQKTASPPKKTASPPKKTAPAKVKASAFVTGNGIWAYKLTDSSVVSAQFAALKLYIAECARANKVPPYPDNLGWWTSTDLGWGAFALAKNTSATAYGLASAYKNEKDATAGAKKRARELLESKTGKPASQTPQVLKSWKA